MPVRTLSPGQLFETLAQATGFRAGLRRACTSYEGSSKARFVELFTNRDEKPTEGETSILQALALMNGPLMASVTSLETSDTLAAVAEAPYLDTPGRIETLYLAALTRRPRPDELERLVPYVDSGGTAGDRSKALADVFWALLEQPRVPVQPLTADCDNCARCGDDPRALSREEHDHETTERPHGGLSRRQMLRLAAAGVVGFSTSGWIEALAADAARTPGGASRASCSG